MAAVAVAVAVAVAAVAVAVVVAAVAVVVALNTAHCATAHTTDRALRLIYGNPFMASAKAVVDKHAATSEMPTHSAGSG